MVLEFEWPAQLVLPVAPAGTSTKLFAGIATSVPGNYEQCGRAFHAIVHPKSVAKEEKTSATETEEDDEDAELRKQLTRFDTDLEDYYGLLALNDFKFVATEKQVRARWKIAAMVCHPDKATPEQRSEAEFRYKALQRGVEILTDPSKRKAYDSSLPFDDSVPTVEEGNTPETFYGVYGPVFNANARFSVKHPVPALGDANTPDKKVNKFYDYWFGFESWREFVHKDEESINDGTWREERRRIERANAKLRAGAKRQEMARLQKLVADAAKKDPRMQRMKAEEEQRKLDKKNELKRQKQALEDAKKRKEEEAKAAEEKKVADEAEAKIQAKLKANTLKGLKKRLRKLGRAILAAEVFLVDRTKALDADDLDYLSKNMEVEELQEVVDLLLKNAGNDDKQVSYKILSDKLTEKKDAEKEQERLLKEKAAAAAEAERLAKIEHPWSVEELKILMKAIQKSTGGAKDWETIAFTINQTKKDASRKDRNIKQIQKKAKSDLHKSLKEAEKEEKRQKQLAEAAESAKAAAEKAEENKEATKDAPAKKQAAGKKKAAAPKAPVVWGRPGNNLKIGLVGMPNVGKSSTFNLLGNLQVAAENFPFCTIKPATTMVPVPDDRFNHLVASFQPTSVMPAVLTVTDIAGLVKGASEGQGLGNEFLANIQAVDAIYHVSRAFVDKDVEHVEGDVNPVRDFEIINNELVKKDHEWVKNYLEATKKKTRNKVTKEQKKEMDTMQKALDFLAAGKEIRHCQWDADDILFLNTLNLLSAKPVVYLVNISTKNFLTLKNKWFKDIKMWLKKNAPMDKLIPYSVTFEQQLQAMADDEERAKYLKKCKTQSMISRIIKSGFQALGCINFFTVGTDEVRAWTVRDGVKAPKAAGVIHGDIEKTFISAEVYSYDDYVEYGGEKEVKKAGKTRAQGKNYTVLDGDIIFFSSGAGKRKK